jgi:hypothetical protein
MLFQNALCRLPALAQQVFESGSTSFLKKFYKEKK